MVNFLDRPCCPWVRAGTPPYSFCPTCSDKHHTLDFVFKVEFKNRLYRIVSYRLISVSNSDKKIVDQCYRHGSNSGSRYFAEFKSLSGLLLYPNSDKVYLKNKNFILIYKFEKHLIKREPRALRNFLIFSLFGGKILACIDLDPDPLSYMNSDPIRIRIRITGFTPKLSLW